MAPAMAPDSPTALPDPNRRLRRYHALSAAVFGAFLLLHIGNHLAMFAGIEQHRAAMHALRAVYRFAPVEAAIMAAAALQVASGLTMAWRRWRTGAGEGVARLQLASGVVLALFVAIHTSAVWTGRLALGVDTDFYFAAGGFHAGYGWFFGPYYALGVTALFVHLGCAAWWHLPAGRRGAVLALAALVGALLGVGFAATMAASPPAPSPALTGART